MSLQSPTSRAGDTSLRARGSAHPNWCTTAHRIWRQPVLPPLQPSACGKATKSSKNSRSVSTRWAPPSTSRGTPPPARRGSKRRSSHTGRDTLPSKSSTPRPLMATLRSSHCRLRKSHLCRLPASAVRSRHRSRRRRGFAEARWHGKKQSCVTE